ncbi:hypothetical protein TSUD_225450 [Trifolium subterraneum]|uniref:Uncharacterized protein n=1 Tax=Trifolium subterraneum TaxID=3900 RepID=A0A2Z6MLF4_TRISU|nr:hypothetical protein TSUD_225450 [Trifolium subterraneum]
MTGKSFSLCIVEAPLATITAIATVKATLCNTPKCNATVHSSEGRQPATALQTAVVETKLYRIGSQRYLSLMLN